MSLCRTVPECLSYDGECLHMCFPHGLVRPAAGVVHHRLPLQLPAGFHCISLQVAKDKARYARHHAARPFITIGFTENY
jgi:hypothetical protein